MKTKQEIAYDIIEKALIDRFLLLYCLSLNETEIKDLVKDKITASREKYVYYPVLMDKSKEFFFHYGGCKCCGNYEKYGLVDGYMDSDGFVESPIIISFMNPLSVNVFEKSIRFIEHNDDLDIFFEFNQNGLQYLCSATFCEYKYNEVEDCQLYFNYFLAQL